MARIYYRKIKEPGSTFTLDMIPTRWREEVRQLLENDGE